jgi:predicted DCC family thiol-disulfide oxidoreductase YuxK
MQELQNKNILFFDGACAFCNKSVQLLMKHSAHSLYFSSLSGNSFKALQTTTSNFQSNSIVLYTNQSFYSEGDALRKLASFVKPFSFAGILLQTCRITPLKVVNFMYGIIARNRFKFQNKITCEFRHSHTQQILP